MPMRQYFEELIMNFDELRDAMLVAHGEGMELFHESISNQRLELIGVVLGFLRDADREFLAEPLFASVPLAAEDNQTNGMWLKRALIFLLTEYWGASHMPNAVKLPPKTVFDLLERAETNFVEVRQLIEKVRGIEVSVLFGMSEIAYAINRC